MSYERDNALDGLRGVAAMCVVVSHIAAMQWTPFFDRGQPATWQQFLWHLGAPALDLFLVLSGYVVARSLLCRPTSYDQYLLARAVRLYPVAWIAVGFGLALRFANLPVPYAATASLAKLAEPLTTADILGLATLVAPLPDAVRINPPLWSLILEMQAAIAMPMLALIARRHPLTLAVAGVFLPLIAAYAFGNAYFLNASGFFIGSALAAAEGRIPALPRPVIALVFFAAALLCRHYLMEDDPLLRIPCAIAAGGVILAIRQGAARALLNVRPALWLGSVSYPLYALHWPLMAACVMIFGAATGIPAAAILSIPLSLASAALLERFVDRPAIALSRFIKSKRQSLSCKFQQHEDELLIDRNANAFLSGPKEDASFNSRENRETEKWKA